MNKTLEQRLQERIDEATLVIAKRDAEKQRIKDLQLKQQSLLTKDNVTPVEMKQCKWLYVELNGELPSQTIHNINHNYDCTTYSYPES